MGIRNFDKVIRQTCLTQLPVSSGSEPSSISKLCVCEQQWQFIPYNSNFVIENLILYKILLILGARGRALVLIFQSIKLLYSLHAWQFCMLFVVCRIFKINFLKKTFRNAIRVSKVWIQIRPSRPGFCWA